MDSMPGGPEAAWTAAGAVLSAIVVQAGAVWRARRSASKKRREGRQDTPRDTAVIFENKDNRAFQYLSKRLEETEAAHRLCEDRADRLQNNQSDLSRTVALQSFSIEILRDALERGGIPVPKLPNISPVAILPAPAKA